MTFNSMCLEKASCLFLLAASIGQFFIVENTGQKTVTVDVKATSDISIKQTLPPLSKGESKRVYNFNLF